MGYGRTDIVPGDNYCVASSRMIYPTQLNYVTHLYQPLIGPTAASLYITLYHELPVGKPEPQYGSHRWLMSVLCTTLDQINQAREKLEAVGLLRTFKNESVEDVPYYEYVLQSPMEPALFFRDDMMSIILLNRIGKTKYRQLRERFLGKAQTKVSSGNRQEWTKGFNQVFTSISPTELMVHKGSETDQFLEEMEVHYPVKDSVTPVQEEEQRISFVSYSPDFTFLEAVLPKSSSGSRRLSQELRRIITELGFFYQLDDIQLSRFLQDPYVYDDKDEISPDRLRHLIKEWYRRQNDGRPPDVQHIQPQAAAVQEDKTLSKEEEHMKVLAAISPIALLEQYQGGGKVSPADIKIIEELARDYDLSPGVINVLLEYVMITNDKQLPRAYITKIAAHWKRLSIKTVGEALFQAKKLYHDARNKTSRSPSSTQPRSAARKTPARQEQLPEWIVRQLEESSDVHESEVLDDSLKQEAMELLRALGEIE